MKRPRSRADRSDPRRVAAEILRRVDTAGSFAAPLLDHREREIVDPRDSGLLHELVLGSLRNRALLDDVLARSSRRGLEAVDPDLRRVLQLGIYEILFLDRIPGYASVDQAVESAKRLAGRGAAAFANGVLRAVARGGAALLPDPPREGDVDALSVHGSHPRWWLERMVSRRGWDATVRTVTANNVPVPTVIRIRAAAGPPGEFADRLREEGIESLPGVYAPLALRIPRGRVAGARSFQGGAWVQDEASQLVSGLLGAPAPVAILDGCAAPGGKTCALADALPPGGRIVAMDRHAGRIGRLRRNVDRLGLDGVLPVVADLTAPPAVRGPFDRVLVDAPCTGTGTFRRRPELRLRVREGDPSALAARQGVLLDRAAQLVSPGGVLVFSVCSIETEEGEDVVHSFLARNHEFHIDDPGPWLPVAARRFAGGDGIVRTASDPEVLDGFQAARFVRRYHGGLVDGGPSGTESLP